MRYFIGFLSVFALVLLVLLLIIRGLSGDDSDKNQRKLSDYARSDTVMRLTIDGPINADTEHQGVRVTIGRSENSVEILQGYRRIAVASQTYANNEQAYITFLKALQLLGYTRGNPDENLRDERGYCPEGDRYIFEIKTGSQEIQRYWRTTCKEGTFRGDTTPVINLFQAQIPDYAEFTKDVEL
jgi:hypothetical protein